MNQKFSGLLSAMLLSSCLLVTAQAQQKYLLKGEIGEDKNGKMVRLMRYKDHSSDSTIIKNGKFQFEGEMAQPSLAYISIATTRRAEPTIGSTIGMPDQQTFYLSAGATTLKGVNITSAVIDNPVQKENVELKSQKKPLEDQINIIRSRIYMGKDKDSIRELKAEAKVLERKLFEVELAFVKQHPDSYVSFDVIRGHNYVIEDADAFEEMYNAMSSAFRNSEEGIKMANGIEIAKRLAIGQPAIEFTQNDASDKPVSLSSLKGKYVLVDFWASWCGPCKMEYPYLHKAYDKYKDRNFEILGVSLDSKKDAWIRSIADNKFKWLLVCDLKGFNNEAALAYGVHAIPRNFLVDPQGHIIARDMRGDDLLEKLDEVILSFSKNSTLLK